MTPARPTDAEGQMGKAAAEQLDDSLGVDEITHEGSMGEGADGGRTAAFGSLCRCCQVPEVHGMEAEAFGFERAMAMIPGVALTGCVCRNGGGERPNGLLVLPFKTELQRVSPQRHPDQINHMA